MPITHYASPCNGQIPTTSQLISTNEPSSSNQVLPTNELPSPSPRSCCTQLPSTRQLPCSNEVSTRQESASQLCDLERQHLVEMFPNCPQSIISEASESITMDSAVDYVMSNWSVDAGM